MASKAMRGLSTENDWSRQPRKYLGDPHDLHFIPTSPIIERPQISGLDEAELRRACALALAKIPHSDDMTDDPFRYLASHIIIGQPPPPVVQEDRTMLLDKVPLPSPALFTIEPRYPETDPSTATPSEISKRETLQTNDTTPMTTPGITPGENTKRFSDAGRRPVTATTLPSNLSTENRTSEANAVYSFLRDPPPMMRPNTAIATRSLTQLPSFARIKLRPVEFESPNPTRSEVIGSPDFNKSLPAIPRATVRERIDTDQPQKERMRGFTRILRTMRLQTTQTLPVAQAKNTAANVPQSVNDLSSIEISIPNKRRFNISSFFNKRPGMHPKRATVG